MSKGSNRRPSAVSREAVSANFDAIDWSKDDNAYGLTANEVFNRGINQQLRDGYEESQRTAREEILKIPFVSGLQVVSFPDPTA